MEVAVQKQSNLTPVSFTDLNKGPRMTSAQNALLVLLKEKIAINEPITRQDMLDFWIKHIKRKESYIEHGRVWNVTTLKWEYDKSKDRIYFYRELYSSKMQSLAWFKSNLGAVIIKGKVLVVPLIED